MRQTVFLTRTATGHKGTPGVLVVPGPDIVRPTMELPWLGNRANRSCIPAGSYLCRRVVSPRFGDTFMVCHVPGRSHILFHWGNVAGNIDLGYRTHSAGCILLGAYTGELWGQPAVLASRFGWAEFCEVMEGVDEFDLVINEVWAS